MSNGFKPAVKAVWQQADRTSSSSGNIEITFKVAAIRIGTSGDFERNSVLGNNSGAFGGAYRKSFYNDARDTAITSTWVCTAANGFTKEGFPYDGEQYWISGFRVEIEHPYKSGQGKLNSVSLYWTK